MEDILLLLFRSTNHILDKILQDGKSVRADITSMSVPFSILYPLLSF